MEHINRKKCLIISVSGIGNTILQSALIEKILASDKFEVDCLFGSRAMASVFKGDSRIRQVFILPTSLAQTVGLYRQLLTRRYYITISCFPSNRPQFHLLPFLILARKRVIHEYGRWNCHFSALSNCKIKANEDLHDVIQNLNLLNPLRIKYKRNPINLIYKVEHEDESKAFRVLRDMNMVASDKILGIHPGAGPLKGKEWGVDRFAEVAVNLLQQGLFSRVLIFGGPEERKVKRKLMQLIGSEQAQVVDAPLSITGALIKRCTFFLSNDTGLMHIAAACGTKVLGIFGPTNWKRTAPFGEKAFFITPDKNRVPCAPCLTYPFKVPKPFFKCNNNFPCLDSISPKIVTEVIEYLMSSDYVASIEKPHTSRVNRICLDTFNTYSS